VDQRFTPNNPDLSAIALACVKDMPTSGSVLSHTSFESLRTPRSLRWDASLEQANPAHMGGRTLARDPCERAP
jgi:hypothetical protein